jgi:polyhydroxyalkanoate synthesis regulator phasin
MIIFFITLVVWMCLRYRLLRRGNGNDNQSESTFRIPRISRLFTYAQAPPETLPKAKPQEESSLPDYTFDYAKNQPEIIESKGPELNKDSKELVNSQVNQFTNDKVQSNASNKTSSASLSNVFDDEDNNDTARHTHKDESLREIQELDNYIDNLSFGFEDTSEEEDGVVEAINPNVVVSIFSI